MTSFVLVVPLVVVLASVSACMPLAFRLVFAENLSFHQVFAVDANVLQNKCHLSERSFQHTLNMQQLTYSLYMVKIN